MKTAQVQLSVLVTGRPEAAYDAREVADALAMVEGNICKFFFLG